MPNLSKETLDFALIVQNIVQFHPHRLLDLCIKFFQDFVTWKVSQNERFAARSKPESVESTLPSAAELETDAGSPVRNDSRLYGLLFTKFMRNAAR